MKGTAADILVKQLEEEGVKYLFGIPSEAKNVGNAPFNGLAFNSRFLFLAGH